MLFWLDTKSIYSLVNSYLLSKKTILLNFIKAILVFMNPLQAWDLYERGELLQLVDEALEGDYDWDEAFKFLKIGLLCTQDMPKIRPSMSEVVKMLTGEMDVYNEKISKPGLLSELMGLKRKKVSSNLISGDTKNMDDSSSGSRDATCATMTFTSLSARIN